MPTTTPVSIDNAADLSALVREGKPIVDYGVAHRDLGNPPPPPEQCVHLAFTSPASQGVIEHYVPDMTVRASGGAVMGLLQAALAEQGQFLPLDADDDMTLGEAIAHNVYGPMRLGYGSVRDLLLGLGFVDGHGRDVRPGGRTVKNVAGYDLTRFLVGSLGQLGVIHEATLRTYAVPETMLVVELSVENPAVLDGVLTDWLLADAAPVGLALRFESHHWSLCAAYAGRSAGCAAQFRSLETFVENLPGAGVKIIGTNHDSLARHRAECQAHRRWLRQADAVVKVIVPPAGTGATCAALRQQLDSALRIEAYPAHGCVFAGGELAAPDAHRLDRLIVELGAQRVWYRRPVGALDIAPFGPPQPDWVMLDRLRCALDPRGLFNPGRFLPVKGGLT